MAVPPYLRQDNEAFELDVPADDGRKRLALSDRGEALLVDELDYGNRDVISWLTARVLVLTGGAYAPEAGTDVLDLAWSMDRSDGGRRPDETELAAIAAYLRAIEVEARVVDTVRELVRSTRLGSILDPEEITSDRRRRYGLSEIARDL